MLTTTQFDQFQREGFLLGPQVINTETCALLRNELDRIIADHDNPTARQPTSISNIGGEAAEVWQIVNISEVSPHFRDLVHHADITAAVARMLGALELRLWHDQIQFKPAFHGGVNRWHQDTPYWPIHSGPFAMTAWVALEDVDENNGCMHMVSGSQRWGNCIEDLHAMPDWNGLPKEYHGEPVHDHSCPVRAGHVHFHHGLTWHGSGPNRSNRPRRAIALHYMSERCLYVAEATHLCKPFVTSHNGDAIKGPNFPVVWRAPATANAHG